MTHVGKWLPILILLTGCSASSQPLPTVSSLLESYLECGREAIVEGERLSAWRVHPLLSVTLDVHIATGDDRWLGEVVSLYRSIITYRGDKQGLPDYSGYLRPQWHRLDRYNIFAVSPYQSYAETDRASVMQRRGWESLRFSDINYSGLILEPMLRFAATVHKSPRYEKLAQEIVTEARLTIDSHDREWRDSYYAFPYGSPSISTTSKCPSTKQRFSAPRWSTSIG